MQQQCITFYRLCDAYLTHIGFRDDPQAQRTTTEVLLVALVASWFFASNRSLARRVVAESGLVPQMLSESQLCRRLQRVNATWQAMRRWLADKQPAGLYLVDSCPLPICRLQRAKRRKLYPDANAGRRGDPYLGYCAAKDEYYCGLKAHVVTTHSGQPVEVLLLCGCGHDLTGLKEMTLALPQNATVYADKAYTDYAYEEQLQAQRQITLLPLRKSNHLRQHSEEVSKKARYHRKRIETTFSLIAAKLPRRIHAVTQAGFESKVMALFVAFALWCVGNAEIADA